jgi:hypothetical protein
MLLLMKESNVILDRDLAVRRLAREHPDWLPVLEAAVAVAADAEAHGGEFPGAAVADELGRRGAPRWFPNLRILVSYGLIEKSGPSTRGGRRAYYRMPARAEVEKALEAWTRRARTASEKRRNLRFIAAGASTEPPADAARQAGEITYEPRSWR